MAMMKTNRLQVGSASWIAQERDCALQIAQAEAEEFTFSARNEVEWLNEHMAEIFSENQVDVVEIFKTPGKLRGKTPRTVGKVNPLGQRVEPNPLLLGHMKKPASTFKVAEDESIEEEKAGPSKSNLQHTFSSKTIHNTFDSGYDGSQSDDAPQSNDYPQHDTQHVLPKPMEVNYSLAATKQQDETGVVLARDSDSKKNVDDSFQLARGERTRKLPQIPAMSSEAMHFEQEIAIDCQSPLYPVLEAFSQTRVQPPGLQKQLNCCSLPNKQVSASLHPSGEPDSIEERDPGLVDDHLDDMHSPSDGSSPMRLIVRKSSFNFASLPAREPLTTKKSMGNQVSRISQSENSRASYFGRQTGGRSLGNTPYENAEDNQMDQTDRDDNIQDTDSSVTRLHNKTSTQRLQDQISMLGLSQKNSRTSKSIPSSGPVQSSQSSQNAQSVVLGEKTQNVSEPRSKPPPGAFPEDDDILIGPSTTMVVESSVSYTPEFSNSCPTDIGDASYRRAASIGRPSFNIPKRGDQQRNQSPMREPVIPGLNTSTIGKSASTSLLRSPRKSINSPELQKPISVSNPNPLIVSGDEERCRSPAKSSEKSFRGSPLKAAKDKFSSILKTSRGLFASSAAASADAKSSAITPSSTRMGSRNGPHFDDVLPEVVEEEELEEEYDGKAPCSDILLENKNSQRSPRLSESPFKHDSRKTRTSKDREERKKEDSENIVESKEAKESQKMSDQLEKARLKVREEARSYYVEQERAAVLQKEAAASSQKQDSQAKSKLIDVSKATRSSPRKTKAQLEAERTAAVATTGDVLANKDFEIVDASLEMPPPVIPRSRSQIGRPAAKRPLKSAKQPAKAKPPTVIRVDTGSQRGHQYHPSNTTLSATLQESLSSQPSAPPQGLKHKASASSLQSKASNSSFKSAATKTLEAAARKKEKDELAAARKREAKLEIERHRAAVKEEDRRKEEQHRRQEVERQREIQRERDKAASIAEPKKTASRQPIDKRRLEVEKIKETRPPPPPPPVRNQPGADLDKALPAIPPRTETALLKGNQPNQASQRAPQDMGRSINNVMHNTTKAPPKRPLPHDVEELHSRPALQRNRPSHQYNEQNSKRRKTDDFDNNEKMRDEKPKMAAPPIRQSGIRQKDIPTKSLFPSGYANVPPPSLQRSTTISQHNLHHSKPAHPMDMAQMAKGPIPFAPSVQRNSQPHKNPTLLGAPNGVNKAGAKSGGKPGARLSPRYQNGENIDLPEIHTDSEDEDSEEETSGIRPGWTDTPEIHRQLAYQEGIDPAEVFGQPGPLNMEEVFSKSKDRFHKFRLRTSSANWSGTDRLTEDEIKRDLEGRDRVRRQGGWTYDSMV